MEICKEENQAKGKLQKSRCLEQSPIRVPESRVAPILLFGVLEFLLISSENFFNVFLNKGTCR